MHFDGTLDLKTELPKYGLTESNIRLFDAPESPDLLDYLDLTKPRKERKQEELLPDGVAESQGRPLLFFVNESQLSIPPKEKEAEFGNLRRILACRGDRAYLARVRPGELWVIPVSLSDVMTNWKPYSADSSEAITFFSRLAQGHFDGEGEPGKADFVFKEMFDLLRKGADQLAELIKPVNVLSLLGRALFFRFLCDRNIVTEQDTKRIAPKANNLLDCFANSENLQATSQWLDRTFNGDFLPLYDEDNSDFFVKVTNSDSVFFHLQAIAQRFKPVGKEAYQAKWSNFDFKHVPVGLLSQVYEAFCWKWENRSAKETSIYYTPRKIAQILVDEAFDGLPKANEARVLDPACGAGVFLVLAFRRLYRERWSKTAERPDTKAIREILDNQLAGFDISSSALKLTALALYLTAIELDPKPIPPEKLKFNQLNGKVLFNHRRQDSDPADGPAIGSLGEHVGSRFDGQYDLVLSNPPWTSLSMEYSSIAAKYTVMSKAIIERKGEITMAQAYQNTDYAPDIPILLKSTEWCKPGGRIAMALPARILFKQEDIPSRARETLFRLIEITGIINGSNLSDTEVWPKMSQPFMLFFARNNRPKDSHAIHFITPHYDKMLNRKGEIRVDSKSAQSVEITATFDEPWFWKALTIGTTLDIEVIRRVKSVDGRRLSEYWKDDLGLTSSTGYILSPERKQNKADFLTDLPNLTTSYNGRFSIDTCKLSPFGRKTAHRPRERKCYRSPLVLVKQSPGLSREHCWAFLSFKDIAFSSEFYGYSSADHPYSDLLAKYLFLFCHSLVWIHYILMTAPVFGAERRRIYKTDLDECPIIPFERLNGEQRQIVAMLSQRLLNCDINVMPEIDAFFGSLYGLDELDLEVIRDTLDVSLPYSESRARACIAPTIEEVETFRQRLEFVIRPFFKVLDKEPQVIAWRPDDQFLQQDAPFGIVFVGERGRATAKPEALFHEMILRLADDTGTTRIIQHLEGGLLVGILRQYRYWTPSRARLLGAEIVRQYMRVFEE